MSTHVSFWAQTTKCIFTFLGTQILKITYNSAEHHKSHRHSCMHCSLCTEALLWLSLTSSINLFVIQNSEAGGGERFIEQFPRSFETKGTVLPSAAKNTGWEGGLG